MLVCLLVVLSGCGGGGTAATSTATKTSAENGMPTQSVVAASPEQIDEWTTKSTKLVDDVQASMRAMGNAANEHDIPAMRAACRQIGDASTAFGGSLPAPERDVTVLMQSAVDGLVAAERQCVSFDASTPSRDFDRFTDAVTSSLNDLVASAKVWGA